MKVKLLVSLAVLGAVAVPAQAKAGGFAGTVIAKQPERGTLLLATRAGRGITVHASTRVHLGDRLSLQGLRLHDGTIRVTRLTVLSHTRRATVRGVVVRQLARSTVVATGRTVITILHRAARSTASMSDHRLHTGTVAEFRVRIDDDELFEENAVVVGQAGDVQLEGSVVSVSPLVVSVEGLPITITVPAGTTLPAGLAAGQRIEVTVHAAGGNVFTLVAIDDENENQAGANEEVEVKGSVVSSTPTQIVVNSHGAVFTFAAPAGVTLPTLPAGTFVEVRGVTVKGVLTAQRVKVEDEGGDH
jgi:hypothetical protein